MKQPLCPCHSNQPYIKCCRRYHQGKIPAPSAETLMRSRYSAYVLNETQYLYRTWDKTTRPSLLQLRQQSDQTFTSLDIINTHKGTQNDDTGTVEFIAHYILKGSAEGSAEDSVKPYQHHEESYFVKQKGHWKYVKEVCKLDSK